MKRSHFGSLIGAGAIAAAIALGGVFAPVATAVGDTCKENPLAKGCHNEPPKGPILSPFPTPGQPFPMPYPKAAQPAPIPHPR
jgi:hypothetical protein